MNLSQYYSGAAEENAAITLQAQDDVAAFRASMERNSALRKQAHKEQQALARKQKNGNKPRRRAKTTPEIKWLRDLISPLVFGEKTPEGVRPSITKDSFARHWNQTLGLPSLSNYRLLDHFQGKDTLYFFGHGWYWSKRTLVMIDIDVLKKLGLGSPEGARRFAAHLKTIWPDLYVETSTNGKGIHGYFVLRKWQCDAVQVNKAQKRLEKWLRAEAKKVNADIEEVEIKGTCMDLTFEDKKVQAVKYGSFAKLPRDLSRFAEWEATTTMRVEDLESKRFDVTDEPVPVAVKVPMPMSVVSGKKKNAIAGSVSGKIISEEELDSIPQFERLYRDWVGPVGLKARKFSVTAHDFAVAMVILRHYKAAPNSDGSLPCRRVEKLWTALFQTGDVDRPWNHHRWKAIRDLLSEKGHIDWKDHRYDYGTIKGEGKGRNKGIACKWAISDGYDWTLARVAALPACNKGETSFVDTSNRNLIPTQGNGQNLKPTPFPIRVELEQKFWCRANEACEHLFAA